MDALEEILRGLARSEGKGPRIVGVDGPAGAGKSTLASRLAAQTGAPVVGIDDFLGWSDLDPERRSWWPRLERQVLGPFLAGRSSRYHRRDWVGDPEGLDVLEMPVELPSGPLLILEGVSTTRRAVADRLALRVWVDAPQDIRLARGLARDGEAERSHWLRWQALEAAFFAADGTRARADVVLLTA